MKFCAVTYACVFAMKLCGVVDISWWLIVPMAIFAYVVLTFEEK